MEKDKKKMMILLPCVVVIWVIIGYRVISAMGGDDSSAIAVKAPPERETTSTVADSFSISADYRDPFLGYVPVVRRTSSGVKKSSNRTKSKEKKEKSEEKKSIPWPSIAYYGLVRNEKRSSHIGLFEIDRKSLLLREGDTVRSLKIIHLDKDSASVKNGKGDPRSFSKNSRR